MLELLNQTVTPDLYPHVTPISRSRFEWHQAQIRTTKRQFKTAQAEVRVAKHRWSNEKHKPLMVIFYIRNTWMAH